jgi:Na+-transporting methylmalonyl-CoA/oxaloacetate decarboxylase gamma subunit
VTFDPPSLPPAGWYDDPRRPGAPQRWRNGQGWGAPIRPDVVNLSQSRLPDIGDWLGRSFAHMIERWRSLATIGLLTVVPSTVLSTMGIARLVEGVVITDSDVIGWSNDRLPDALTLIGIGVVFGFIGFLAAIVLMLADADARLARNQVTEPGQGELTTSSEINAGYSSTLSALRVAPGTAGRTAVVTVGFASVISALVLITIAATPIGILLILASIPLFAYAALRLSFINYAIVDRPGTPLRRTLTVSKGRFWATVGRLLILALVIGAVSTAGNLARSLANLFGAKAGANGADFNADGSLNSFNLDSLFNPSPSAVIVASVIALASSIFVSGLWGAAMAMLYRSPPKSPHTLN